MKFYKPKEKSKHCKPKSTRVQFLLLTIGETWCAHLMNNLGSVQFKSFNLHSVSDLHKSAVVVVFKFAQTEVQKRLKVFKLYPNW